MRGCVSSLSVWLCFVRLFTKHGTLGRVLLPPSKTVGMVEFIEPNDAKRAFKSLAYTKFKHVPLYLEWAPVGVFTQPAARTSTTIASDQGGGHSIGSAAKVVPASGAAEHLAAAVAPMATDDQDENSATIYVKNVNFDSTEESLRKAFAKVGQVKRVTIAKKKNPKYKIGGKDSK